jgi:hypothetical protein
LRQRLTLRAKTHPFNLEETKSYITQRLRIAGSNGDLIFEAGATVALFRYSLGIPRIINLLCEHCLVSAFVDEKKTVSADVVDSVARDFDLTDGNAAGAMTAPVPLSEKFDLVEALRTLATLADRLRQSEEQDLPKERKL